MRIGVIGINHKSAGLLLREKLAKIGQRLFGPANSKHAHFSYVLLSTCNRTEVYFHSEDPAQTHTYLLNALRHEIKEEFEHRIYSYFGRDCFFHLARVTAGVDSALVGETEIQGQVKRAYEVAMEYSRLPRELHFLFQKCLKIGKNVRSAFCLTRGLPSLEEGVLNAAVEVLGPGLNSSRILFVGVSEINHKVFTSLKRKGFGNITFCNRSDEKARALADREQTDHLLWREIHQWVNFDLTIFGTKSPRFLVHRDSIQRDVSCKLIIDLSVPRNVDPRVGGLPGLNVLNIDQLNETIDKNRKVKAELIGRIETQLIAEAVDAQVEIFKSKERQRLSGTLLCQAI